MPVPAPILKRLREILSVPGDRVGKARRISAAIRETGGYRWVGILEVSPEKTGIMAWSGREAAPGAARSEVVLPVPGAAAGQVVGLLHIVSDAPHTYGEDDRRRLEECAALLGPLWE
jgi:hypothetical protein